MMVTSQQYLRLSTSKLKRESIETARLDSLLLMEYVLKIDRAKILANPDFILSTKHINVLNLLLEKRSRHTPIAQITKHTEFYGRSFFVNKDVLIPRPETETMIDHFKHLVVSDKDLLSIKDSKGFIRVADIGTGSGAIGITAGLEVRDVHVDLIDIDRKALKVAQKNVANLATNIYTIRADLLPKNSEEYDIILSNLPYVPDDFHINLAAGHEPKLAIYGGPDGLNIYRKLFKIMEFKQHKPLYILIEALPFSHDSLKAIAYNAGYVLKDTDDFIQIYKLRDLPIRS